ncbi:MAG: SRPBCC domain-containing protein [Acidimicrobiia bacterium]
MTEPIILEFEVRASPERAFRVWTAGTSIWWPRSHTVTGSADLSIVFEPRVGGRIFERAPDGTEHDWGEVLAWDPPSRLAYRWHLFFDPDQATEIEVTFVGTETGARVRLVQTGFERLGAPGAERRRRTETAWLELTAKFTEAAGP